MGIGARIKDLRKQANLTQPELAERIGVHETTIRRWEQERDRGPDGKAVTLLAEVLKTTPEYLLNDSRPAKQPEQKSSPFKNTGYSLVYERNGERMELPPTAESYAIFRDIAARIANREPVTMRTPAMA